MGKNKFLSDLLIFVVKQIDNRYYTNFYASNFFDYLRLSNYRNNVDMNYNFYEYLEDYDYLYNLLEDRKSKETLLKIISYKLLGRRRVKFYNLKEYKNKINYFKKCIVSGKKFYPLKKYDLSKYGYDIKLYCSDFILSNIINQKQYYHPLCHINEGDWAIDAGGCFGETALLFSCQSGKAGKIFSFEYSKAHLDVLNYNLSENPKLLKNIQVISSPIYEKSDVNVYCSDDLSISSNISLDKKKLEYKTISIDDFMEKNNIRKMDFIKMDIEGSEFSAIKGCVNTIKKYRPKLAISVYHKYDDFGTISKFINELNLGYKFYLINHSLFYHEIVLYAISDKK